MSRPKVVTRVVSDTVQRFTIWDNLDRHEAELAELGATEEDLQPLRDAAAAVDAAEGAAAEAAGENPVLNAQGLDEITAPVDLPNGWKIQPPTAVARRWAIMAVMKVTGGSVPADDLSAGLSIMAGIWVLWAWGTEQRDTVMQVLTGAGRLAELLPTVQDKLAQIPGDVLTDTYLRLMGLKKKVDRRAEARTAYAALLSSLQTRFSAASTPPSSGSSSGPGARAASGGPSSRSPSRPASSPRSAGSPSARSAKRASVCSGRRARPPTA